MIGSLVFSAIAVPELAAGEERLQDFPDVAVSLLEPRGEPVDERRRWVVGDEILCQLVADVMGGGGASGQNLERLLALRLTARLHRVTEEHFGAVIMASAFKDSGILGE